MASTVVRFEGGPLDGEVREVEAQRMPMLPDQLLPPTTYDVPTWHEGYVRFFRYRLGLDQRTYIPARQAGFDSAYLS